MATRKPRSSPAERIPEAEPPIDPRPNPDPTMPSIPAMPTAGGGAGGGAGQTTGRFIIIFKHPAIEEPSIVKSTMSKFAGVKSFATSADYADAAISGTELAQADVMHFRKTGIVVVAADDERLQSLATSAMDESSAILAIEPEYIAYALAELDLQYLRGYRDAVNALYDRLAGGGGPGSPELGDAEDMAVNFVDNNQFTWGLQATRVHTSRFSGQGVKLAVLDTGFDLRHPDFQGRPVVSQSFVPGQAVQDGHGHGTHCVGTSCGPQRPIGSRRYGCAYSAQIHVGKVLNNQGSGATGAIVAGIEWAMSKGCQVVSMSLGANVDQKVQQYEVPIRRALAAGTLIVAAAGNNASRRAGNFGFVSAPANADAAMAVAALDSRLAVADFSARSSLVTGVGGKIDIAGPGVNVYSSWPMPTRYNTISGTSMATPHVAGIAALWCQATGTTGPALWNKLIQNTRPLTSASAADVGTGLVQAPQ